MTIGNTTTIISDQQPSRPGSFKLQVKNSGEYDRYSTSSKQKISQIVTIDVLPTDTIGWVLYHIARLFRGHPTISSIKYNDKYYEWSLSKNRTLASCGINEKTIIPSPSGHAIIYPNDMWGVIGITVRTLMGRTFTIEVMPETVIAAVKYQIAEKIDFHFTPEQQMLFYTRD
eukprot:UN03052